MHRTQNWYSVTTWRDEVEGVWEDSGGRGSYVCLWLIHVDLWQKLSQYCKVNYPPIKILFNWFAHGKPCGSPYTAREGKLFYRVEKEVGRTIINKESMACHWLNYFKERQESLRVRELPSGLPISIN